MDNVRIWAPKLAPLLEDGERALEYGHASYHPGREDLGRPKPRLLSRDPADWILGGPTAEGIEAAENVVSGTSLVGWAGCAALAFKDALSADPHLLLTDRRVIVVRRTPQATLAATWQLPRRAVMRLERAPRFGQAGRVWIALGDGSGLAVVLGYFRAGAARRLVTAWGQVPGTPVA